MFSRPVSIRRSNLDRGRSPERCSFDVPNALSSSPPLDSEEPGFRPRSWNRSTSYAPCFELFRACRSAPVWSSNRSTPRAAVATDRSQNTSVTEVTAMNHEQATAARSALHLRSFDHPPKPRPGPQNLWVAIRSPAIVRSTRAVPLPSSPYRFPAPKSSFAVRPAARIRGAFHEVRCLSTK
jgi:hypothetical protein